MDFRFRAIDNQPPAAPNSSKCSSDPPPRDDSVERRIREEITIREMARRRMLEVEIRREIIMEQELAILRVMAREQSFDEQLISMKSFDRRMNHIVDQCGKSSLSALQVQLDSSSLNSSLLPPLTEPRPKPADDDQKDKLVFLTRPEPQQFEAKRKAERSQPTATEAEAEADTEPFGRSLKKAKNEIEYFFCKTCQITSTSQRSFDAHLLGKKHRANSEASDGLQLAAKVLENTAPTMVEEEEESKNNTERAGSEEKVKEPEKKSLYKFWCEVCQIGTQSRNVMKDHNMGRKHRTRLLQLGMNQIPLPN